MKNGHMHPSLQTFRSACEAVLSETAAPAQIVRRLAPQMHHLVDAAEHFLEPGHRRGDPHQYARNLIFADENSTLALFTLVWAPGQWTPIHDHGTWGIVGVVEGILEEQSFMRVDANAAPDRDDGIELRPGSLVLLPPGGVSTFVPDPDHIHEAGVAADREPTLSLHLYGRVLNEFHIYHRETGTREVVSAPFSDSGSTATQPLRHHA